MVCPKCNSELKDGVSFCNKCGYDLRDIKPVEPKKSSKKYIIIIAVAIVVIIASIILLVYSLNKKPATPDNQQTPKGPEPTSQSEVHPWEMKYTYTYENGEQITININGDYWNETVNSEIETAIVDSAREYLDGLQIKKVTDIDRMKLSEGIITNQIFIDRNISLRGVSVKDAAYDAESLQKITEFENNIVDSENQ